MVSGSLAMGDYVAGVSDLDLVAVVDRPINRHGQRAWSNSTRT
jgi:predicted nucleotidyltransferase